MNRDIDELYSKKLLARALTCFSQFRQERIISKNLNEVAKRYYQEHSAVDRKKKGFDALVSYAIYSKQSQNAKAQHRFILLFKALTSLRDYHENKLK